MKTKTKKRAQMMECVQMKRGNLSFTLLDGLSWNSDNDYSPLSTDSMVHTEGTIYFLHEGQVSQLTVYLLEFLLETKTQILRNFGSSVYQYKVAMPFSADGYILSRNRNFVSIKHLEVVIMSSTWDEFLQDFISFELALERAMKCHFPLMSSSMDFKVLF